MRTLDPCFAGLGVGGLSVLEAGGERRRTGPGGGVGAAIGVAVIGGDWLFTLELGAAVPLLQASSQTVAFLTA